jgi:transposase
MIDYQRFCQIKHLSDQQGLHASQIANQRALDPRTVSYWLSQDHFRPRKPTKRRSKLDPFQANMVRMLEKYPYSAAQILQRLREQGYGGGYSILKDYVRHVRPRRQPAFLTLAFAPGACAQVDWGSFGSVKVGQTRRRLSFFVMVLCYRRMMSVECTVSQTMEHFLACHQHAFEYVGGLPKKIMVDNLKSAVLKRALGKAPMLTPTYLDFANHQGCTITPCNVGKGNEKGRVENAVGSVKKHFLAGLDIPDFSALNPAARHWLDTVANVLCARRNAGETHRSVAQRTALSQSAAASSVRYCHGLPGQSLQAVSHSPRYQPLLRSGTLCRSSSDAQNLSRPRASQCLWNACLPCADFGLVRNCPHPFGIVLPYPAQSPACMTFLLKVIKLGLSLLGARRHPSRSTATSAHSCS